LINLYRKQYALDEYIRKTRNITVPETELLSKVFVAAVVEVGEFYFEEDREKALFEYVDILHFLLRINNILNLEYMLLCNFRNIYGPCMYEGTATRDSLIVNLVARITTLANATRCFKYWSNKESDDKYRLMDLFSLVMYSFMSLGNYMKFTSDEILETYDKKREENYRRQQEGY
jgi:dimeric dUTPase (all-alpha-NTP-PPase superfamily)